MRIMLLLFISISAHAKLLDMTAAIINERIITLSEITRIKQILPSIAALNPYLFPEKSHTNKTIVKDLINHELISAKLSELGRIITDEIVQGDIDSRMKSRGASKKELTQWLNSVNLSYDEYFEITRKSIQNSTFILRVIYPLVSVTEQEIKNTYYKTSKNKKSLSFKYDLVDFSIPSEDINKKDKKNLKSILSNYQLTGTTPRSLKNMSTESLSGITAEGLTKELSLNLRRGDEGSFANPIKLGSYYHVFYIKKKDLVESQDFEKKKGQIRQKLFEKAAKSIQEIWLKREKERFFVKNFLVKK